MIANAAGRSLGLKLILVGVLAFLMWIPCLAIYALVWERSSRAESVRDEIYGRAGGRQTISGPIILVPAMVDTGKTTAHGEPIAYRTTFVFTPAALNIEGKVVTSVRRRSIYDATVYDADLSVSGEFAEFRPPAVNDGKATILWKEARLALKLASDDSLKGIRAEPALKVDGAIVDVKFEPGVPVEAVEGGETGGVSAPFPIGDPDKAFSFSLKLPVSGGGSLYFAPVGQDTNVTLVADWPHPSFQGARLPEIRSITDQGFTASWKVPYLSRRLAQSFVADASLASLDGGKAFGVDFIATDGPYQSVNRALKYALMFVGIVFLTFFLFEATMDGRAHAAQYVLLGAAQVVFYLLVLAFAEHIGFENAFFGASGATVLLSGLYAATVFRSVFKGVLALFFFSCAYGLIYLLMQSEDYALLIGSVAAFGAVALTMAVTRKLDWYETRSASP